MNPLAELLLLADLVEQEEQRRMWHDIARSGQALLEVLPPEQRKARFWAILDNTMEAAA